MAGAPCVDHGAARVSLTGGDSYSSGLVETTLAEYLRDAPSAADGYLRDASAAPGPSAGRSPSVARANESRYLFGPQTDPALSKTLSSYRPPACGGAWCAPEHLAASFGVGGAGSGVSFHTHGSGFGEVLRGRKRWLLCFAARSLL